MHRSEADYIPAIRTQKDGVAAQQMMQDAPMILVSGPSPVSVSLTNNTKVWVDSRFDGFEFIFGNDKTLWENDSPGWFSWITSLPKFADLSTEKSAEKAKQSIFNELVGAAMDSLLKLNPYAISVPQVPYGKTTSRNNINKKLAKAAGEWKVKNWPQGTLILPVVLEHGDAYRNMTACRPRISAICKAFDASQAEGVSVVHAGFDDLGGTGNMDREKFPALIQFHELLNESLPENTLKFAGPYWGLNLILWARGLIDAPIVSCGSGYRHYLPTPNKAPRRQGRARVAITPLKRWYPASKELQSWLQSASGKLATASDARNSIDKLAADISSFLGPAGRVPARNQTCKFYMNWIREISAINPEGRSLYLFQDFSSAVVNGSTIGLKLPKHGTLSSSARDPGFIAQQFMLQCLPR